MSYFILFGSDYEENMFERDFKSNEIYRFDHKPNHEVISILLESKYMYLHCYKNKENSYEYISTFGPLLR